MLVLVVLILLYWKRGNQSGLWMLSQLLGLTIFPWSLTGATSVFCMIGNATFFHPFPLSVLFHFFTNILAGVGTKCKCHMLGSSYIFTLFSYILFSFRCEAFPTYPRTYDMVHAEGLLSLEYGQQRRCTMLDLFSEIDRLLRPEVTKSNIHQIFIIHWSLKFIFQCLVFLEPFFVKIRLKIKAFGRISSSYISELVIQVISLLFDAL